MCMRCGLCIRIFESKEGACSDSSRHDPALLSYGVHKRSCENKSKSKVNFSYYVSITGVIAAIDKISHSYSKIARVLH